MNEAAKLIKLLLAAIISIALLFTSCSSGGTNSSKSEQSSITAVAQAQTTKTEDRTDEVFDIKKYADKLTLRFFFFEGKDSEKSGDSMFIMTPDGATMLIDSGTPESGKQILGYLKKMGIEKVDYVVATHLHIDHIGGFSTILNQITASKVLFSSLTKYNTSTAKSFFNVLEAKKIPTQIIKRGDEFQLGKDVKVEVLHPEENIVIPEKVVPEDNAYILNDNSVVLKLTHKKNTFLLTGDLYREGESILIKNWGSKLDADLIKVPHHGAGTSSSKELVDAVTPKISVVIHNMFGAMEVYERYQKAGSKVLVTGLDGNLLVTSDGENLNYITERDRKGSLK